MDKGRVLRLVLIPILAGLIVTLVAQRLMSRSEPTAAAPKVETVPVVVVATKESIPARTKLTESQFAIKQVPKEYVTGSEVAAVKDVTGKINIVDLLPGEILLTQRLTPEGQGALPYRIPAGKRAVTIRLDELNGVAGHPNPGDLVDIVAFLPEKKLEEPAKTTYPANTRILYESVLVLAKGLASSEGPAKQSGGEERLSSITLALTPQEAAEVALYEQIGYLKLILRPAVKESNAGHYLTDELKYRNNPAGAGR